MIRVTKSEVAEDQHKPNLHLRYGSGRQAARARIDAIQARLRKEPQRFAEQVLCQKAWIKALRRQAAERSPDANRK